MTQVNSRTQVECTFYLPTFHLPVVGSAAENPEFCGTLPQNRKGRRMARPRSTVPSYRKHKQSGQAIVTLTDGLGNRRDVLLGKYGTRESRTEYARVIAEWETSGRTLAQPAPGIGDLRITELIERFWGHVEQHYRRPDGTATNEQADYKLSLRPLKRLYGNTPARDFGPLALKAVREAMISGSWLTEAEKENRQKNGHKLNWARGVANQRIGRIRRMFRWAVENELIPAPVYQALMAVRRLARGRSEARETEPVKPVPLAFVTQTLPYLRPQTRAMVELQLVSGMRPGEVIALRGIDLDMSGKVWLYRPGSDQGREGQHKTAWRGHQRVVHIGPRGQEILRLWLRLKLQEHLFQEQELRKDHQPASRVRGQLPIPVSGLSSR